VFYLEHIYFYTELETWFWKLVFVPMAIKKEANCSIDGFDGWFYTKGGPAIFMEIPCTSSTYILDKMVDGILFGMRDNYLCDCEIMEVGSGFRCLRPHGAGYNLSATFRQSCGYLRRPQWRPKILPKKFTAQIQWVGL
jgi:hypothetical protein